jgi:LPS sulfotransferase NodH
MTASPKIFIICTTARSGSNLVCDYLFNTGRLGRPTEVFNPQIVVKGAYNRRYTVPEPVVLADYVAWLKENFATRNGVLGLKMLWEDMEFLGGSPAVSELLDQAHLIRLTRRRKLAQAVSYYLAQETGQWVASDPAHRQPEDVAFDFGVISRHLDRLCLQDARWDAELDTRGLEALHWHFEDFVRDPAQHVRSLADRLGVDIADDPIRTSLTKQSTARSQAFIDAFRREARDGRTGGSLGETLYENVRFQT